jgi:hypothetical protein
MVFVVYHTYLVGQWKTLVKSQLDRLVNSGLYDSADQIWVTINRDRNSEQEVRDFLSGYPKLNLEFHEHNVAEYPGIKKVRELASNNDAKILYFHTKGVSNNYKTYSEKEPSPEKIENVNSWRECMEYFLIDKWTDAVEKLNEYDNVGVTCVGGWYWGNFWWSKSEHLRKTKEVGLWSRWAYEAWLNDNTPQSKNYEFYHMGFNPFLTNIKDEFYKTKNSEIEGKNIVIRNAVYGTPSFQIDEGYSTTPTNVVVDVTEVVKMFLEKTNNKKLDFYVDNNTMGGDPAWGQRKSMTVEFYPEGYPHKIYKMGVTEGHSINFQF